MTTWILPHVPTRSSLALLILLAVLMLSPVDSSAHSPEDMTATFDLLTESVTIQAVHPVDDGRTHYIEAIQVEVDGSFHQLDTYYNDRQWDDQYFNFTVTNVKAQEGDTITVTLSCVQGGTIVRTLTVSGSPTVPIDPDPQLPPGLTDPDPSTPSPEDDPGWASSFVYIAIAIVVMAVIFTVMLGVIIGARTSRKRRGY